MRKHIVWLVSLALVIATFAPGMCIAEKAPLFPEELRNSATEIFTGEIARVYSFVSASGDWEVTHSVAEIHVKRVEKGKHDAPLAYVRFHRNGYIGSAPPTPHDSGHSPVPKPGQLTRVYVARAKDGGFDAVWPNGFEFQASQAKK
jgi:hypothetical protein